MMRKFALFLLFCLPQFAFAAPVLISSGSLGTGTTFDIKNIPDHYDYLILDLFDVSSNTATRYPKIRVSTDGGTTFFSTGSFWDTTSGASGATDSVWGYGTNLVAAARLRAHIDIYGYVGSSTTSFISTALRSDTTSGSDHIMGMFASSTSPINALRIFWNGSGNFDGGTYSLYGVGLVSTSTSSGTSSPFSAGPLIIAPLATSSPNQTQLNLFFAAFTVLFIMFFVVWLFKTRS